MSRLDKFKEILETYKGRKQQIIKDKDLADDVEEWLLSMGEEYKEQVLALPDVTLKAIQDADQAIWANVEPFSIGSHIDRFYDALKDLLDRNPSQVQDWAQIQYNHYLRYQYPEDE